MSEGATRPRRDPYRTAVVLTALLLLTLWRLLVLKGYPLDLHFDEAQYWDWSRDLAFGYFSKPPLVAWVIALTTEIAGTTVFGVKLAAPFTHLVTALFLYALGRRLYDARAGFFAALLYATLPAVSLSSMVISTDPLLVMFWAAGLYTLHRAVEAPEGGTGWWALTGIALGLGLLAKYTMIAFAGSVVLYLLWAPQARPQWRTAGPWLALALGALLIAPNLGWNAANDWITFAHTGDNASLGGPLLNPGNLLRFLGSQLGVFGPLTFLALLWLLVHSVREAREPRARFLLAFILPLFVVIVVQSLLSRANANWAAPCYVAAAVLVAGRLLESRAGTWLLQASIILHLLVAVAMYNFPVTADAVGWDLAKQPDPYKKVRGWAALGDRLMPICRRHTDRIPAFDDRELMTEMLFYMRPCSTGAVKINPDGAADDHYDLTRSLRGPAENGYLWFTVRDDPGLAERYFEKVETVAVVRVTPRPGLSRTVRVYALDGFKGY